MGEQGALRPTTRREAAAVTEDERGERSPEGRACVRPEPGVAYLGASRQHLMLNPDMTIGFTDHPKTLFFRPAVDLFFKTAADNWTVPGIAVLLTGMGRDGAQGLATLRNRGWHTIAQDEATSVVYGMPKAARELNAADEILPIDKIALSLIQWTQKIRKRQAS